MTALARPLRWLIIAVLAWASINASAWAAGTVEIPPVFSMIDLAPNATPVAATRQNLAIEAPGDLPETRKVLQLRAKGKGPTFNWTVFTIRNSAPQKRKLVLLIEEQRFVGSGLLEIKPFAVRPTNIAFSDGQGTIEQEMAQGGVGLNFAIEPNATVTFAIEAPTTLRTVKLYSLQAFAARESSLSFLRGAVMVLAGVLVFAAIALYGFRPHTAFIAGSFFALTAMGFMGLDSGLLGGMATRLRNAGFPPDTVRAAAEGLMLLGLAVCLSAFAGLRQRGPFTLMLGLLLLLGCLGNLAYAYVEPILSTQVSRIGFASLTGIAFVVGYMVRLSSYGVVRRAMFFWSALAIWVFYAAAVAITDQPTITMQVGLLGGLALVLLVMIWTLVRFSLTQGFLAKPFLTDANRRSLALSGAQHFVWDWLPQDDRIDIGAELASHLGYQTAEWMRDPGQAFLSILHAQDEPSYRVLMDARSLQPNSFHELELRLRDARNAYRSFALRVRALAGPGGRASRCIGTLTEITRRTVVEDNQTTADVVTDTVTGLPTRAIFTDRLGREVTKPLALPVRVFCIGLQRFKSLNDGLGHEIGDQLLLIAGRRIAECLSPTESVSRLSGSQFAVMFIETIDGHDMKTLAEKIRKSLAEPVALGGQSVYLTPSLGISLTSSEGYTASELLDQAAAALQQAQKNEGRSAIRVFQASDESQLQSSLTLESELRRAINGNDIEVLYQPVVDLQSRVLVGMEALARWRHPQQGLLPPSKFLAMAEQAGLMPEITMVVLGEAVRQMGVWQRTVIRNQGVYVAVNIPADQLNDQSFVDRLRSMINREGIRPDAIKIEITESVAMRHIDRARQFIDRLKALGIGVACDDFGTGFSSLSSLRDLPFDTLKIDRSFIVADAVEGRGGVILDTVVALAHNLGMVVVAEGIESEAQADRLQALGCDMGQGFYFAEPISPREIGEILAILPRVEKEPRPSTASGGSEQTVVADEVFEEVAETSPPDVEATEEIEPHFEFEPIVEPEPEVPLPPPPRPVPRPVVSAPLTVPKSVPKPLIVPAPVMAPRPAPPPPERKPQPVAAAVPSILGAPGQLASELRAAAKPEVSKPRKRKRKGRPSYKEIY